MEEMVDYSDSEGKLSEAFKNLFSLPVPKEDLTVIQKQIECYKSQRDYYKFSLHLYKKSNTTFIIIIKMVLKIFVFCILWPEVKY